MGDLRFGYVRNPVFVFRTLRLDFDVLIGNIIYPIYDHPLTATRRTVWSVSRSHGLEWAVTKPMSVMDDRPHLLGSSVACRYFPGLTPVNKLYCHVTDARGCEQLAKVAARQCTTDS